MDPQTPEGLPGFVPEGFFVALDANSQSRAASIAPSSTKLPHSKVRHVGVGFLTVKEAASKLGVNPMTVTRWCESGKLPAIAKPYGKRVTWQISPQAIELLAAVEASKAEAVKVSKRSSETLIGSVKAKRSHASYYDSWVTAMTGGLLTGKAFSKRTVDDYKSYVKPFLDKGREVSIEALQAELLVIPVEQVAKRQHLYKAVVCFGKYLLSEGALGIEFLEKVKPFYPKRHVPPKRTSINETELKQLLAACTELKDRFIVALLGETGLRATEACQLTWGSIDLDKSCMTIIGKGGKRRSLGLTPLVREVFIMFRKEQGSVRENETILRNKLEQPMTRNGLYQRIERLGIKANVQVSPHALRRAFVTINANKGRPLQMLQMACGHSRIKTTMDYCMTSEQEVVDAMKGWD